MGRIPDDDGEGVTWPEVFQRSAGSADTNVQSSLDGVVGSQLPTLEKEWERNWSEFSFFPGNLSSFFSLKQFNHYFPTAISPKFIL